jgi:hypothetical protein
MLLIALMVILSLLPGTDALSQEKFPNRPIQFIIP